jgi:integrase/recombinase XerD
MTDLHAAAHDYLAVRRQLGFELKEPGRRLLDYVSFVERVGAEHVTSELALMWATSVSAHPYTWRRRLGVVRGFARYLSTIDPQTEVPSEDLLPASLPRVAPYLYSSAEIQALMGAARALSPRLRAATFETLIGLLAVSGLRRGEALGLDRADVDLDAGALHVRAAKLNKQREVPLHDSTTRALREYSRLRDRYLPGSRSSAFFVSPQDSRLTGGAFNATFAKLIRQVGLDGRGERARPRAHDLRHSFAVRTLIDWYRNGQDVDAQLPLLSTYLGHYAGDLVKRAERLGFARRAFQAARRRPPGVLAMPTWMKAVWIRQAFRRIRERLSRSMIAVAASRESRRLASRRLTIARASRARSTGLSRRSRILGVTSSPASGSSALTASKRCWRSGVSSCGSVIVSARSS